VVDPVKTEVERDERIYRLINAWHEPDTPEGQVARATTERWGVPLRPRDVAELEYREWYLGIDAPLIEQWSESHASSTYAGFYMDHRAGGRIRVGYTSSEGTQIEALKQQSGFVATDRIAGFPMSPSHPLTQLRSLQNNVAAAAHTQGTLFTRGGFDIPGNRIKVGSSNQSVAESYIHGLFGLSAPIAVYQDAEPPEPQNIRERQSGPLRAGDVIFSESGEWACTAGFGAKNQVGQKADGQPLFESFLLTAAHCEPGYVVSRFAGYDKNGKYFRVDIGHRSKSGFDQPVNGFGTDGEAILLDSPGLMPHWIQLEPGSTQNITRRRSQLRA
jgi:hypothetical protein